VADCPPCPLCAGEPGGLARLEAESESEPRDPRFIAGRWRAAGGTSTRHGRHLTAQFSQVPGKLEAALRSHFFCRNVLIDFGEEACNRVIQEMTRRLPPTG